jgi:hypothetical protein
MLSRVDSDNFNGVQSLDSRTFTGRTNLKVYRLMPENQKFSNALIIKVCMEMWMGMEKIKMGNEL